MNEDEIAELIAANVKFLDQWHAENDTQNCGCTDEALRGYVCSYHEGFEQGIYATLEYIDRHKAMKDGGQ